MKTKALMHKLSIGKEYVAQVRQQGDYESVHRDLNVGFSTWEFSTVELKNPFPENEGFVHLWHGAKDMIVPVSLQQFIAGKLPWIHYHELPGAGHMFPHADGMSDSIAKGSIKRRKIGSPFFHCRLNLSLPLSFPLKTLLGQWDGSFVWSNCIFT